IWVNLKKTRPVRPYLQVTSSPAWEAPGRLVCAPGLLAPHDTSRPASKTGVPCHAAFFLTLEKSQPQPSQEPPAAHPARRFRPRLEALEDRHLLPTSRVVLARDKGGPSGKMVTAPPGDLRYCVQQADAAHTATSDSIGFSSALTSSPTTIN